MTAGQAPATVTRTWTGAIRIRNAREHRALEHLWWWANTVRNALCEQALSIREHNRRTFLRHGTDWTPGDFASVLDPPDSRVVAHPTLEAFELRDSEWALIACAIDDEPVSVRPFDAITFNLGELWS